MGVTATQEPKRQRRKTSGIQINEELAQGSTVHTNIAQEVIVTTKDKINLALINHQKYNKAKSDWVAPFSILLSVIASLAAADFKSAFSIPADTWRSLFIIVGVASGFWLLYCFTIYSDTEIRVEMKILSKPLNQIK
ncbi:hypothetical protein PAV_15c00910 [Paenibacillus alvei DSM 29]|uniref:hypothetical protein n=1 Tax=Paenibacillus alvei TaxID=44250 RepID=UPI000289465E|nr:hypothetical protein [Paenibacillus alvei]EJW14302.1 hypothetical protein PAV_15c00910 [Paenibacillus alvei DSM 29]